MRQKQEQTFDLSLFVWKRALHVIVGRSWLPSLLNARLRDCMVTVTKRFASFIH